MELAFFKAFGAQEPKDPFPPGFVEKICDRVIALRRERFDRHEPTSQKPWAEQNRDDLKIAVPWLLKNDVEFKKIALKFPKAMGKYLPVKGLSLHTKDYASQGLQ